MAARTDGSSGDSDGDTRPSSPGGSSRAPRGCRASASWNAAGAKSAASAPVSSACTTRGFCVGATPRRWPD